MARSYSRSQSDRKGFCDDIHHNKGQDHMLG